MIVLCFSLLEQIRGGVSLPPISNGRILLLLLFAWDAILKHILVLSPFMTAVVAARQDYNDGEIINPSQDLICRHVGRQILHGKC